MATYITPRHPSARPAAGSAEDGVNARRPHLVRAEPLLEPTHAAGPNVLDDAPLPPTVLRLPDLAVAAKSVPAMRGKLKLTTIAQWVAIALGALLALWLIFGGRASALQVDEAPTWSAPGPAHAAAPPSWNGPGSAQAAAQAPAPPAPSPTPVPTTANPTTATPATAAPANATPTQEPPFDPYHQLQPESGSDAAAGPPASDAARQMPMKSDAAAPREPIHTAMRPGEAADADRYQPSEAQPLNVTVPVPQ